MVIEREGQSDDEEDELEEVEELAKENSKRGWGKDDIDNLEDEDYHHDTSDDEDPRPKKRRKGRLQSPLE